MGNMVLYDTDWIFKDEFINSAKRDYIDCYDCEPTEKALDNFMYDELNTFFEDLEGNLKAINKMLPNNCKILALADVGTWRGRVNGYKIFNNLQDILGYHTCDGDYKLEIKNKLLSEKFAHHDGTNYIQFYLFKTCDTSAGDKFLNRILKEKIFLKVHFTVTVLVCTRIL